VQLLARLEVLDEHVVPLAVAAEQARVQADELSAPGVAVSRRGRRRGRGRRRASGSGLRLRLRRRARRRRRRRRRLGNQLHGTLRL
jgi:hypothetical protein